MPREILINGKFYSAQMTGVHRVAEELLRALDELASAGEITLPRPAKIMLPANAARIPRFQSQPIYIGTKPENTGICSILNRL